MHSKEIIGNLECVVSQFRDTQPKAAVILCHGFGAPGTDLVPVASELLEFAPALKDVRFIFPAAPIELEYDSCAWWPISIQSLQEMSLHGDYSHLANVVPPELESRRRQIMDIVEHLNRSVGLTRPNIVVGGFSQGAMLATDCCLNSDIPFGGLIVWSGTLINQNRWKELVKTKSRMDVVQSHGFLDAILPFSGAIALRDLFKSAGHNVNFLPFQGYHAISPSALKAAAELISNVLAVSV